MDNPLAKKLLIKPGSRVLVRNAPQGYLDKLVPLPENVQLKTEAESSFDVILHFVKSKSEVDSQTRDSLNVLKDKGILWMAYPKRSKGGRTDLNRDSGWDALWDASWVGISIIAIDETWAALRFRPAADVKRKPDSIFLKG